MVKIRKWHCIVNHFMLKLIHIAFVFFWFETPILFLVKMDNRSTALTFNHSSLFMNWTLWAFSDDSMVNSWGRLCNSQRSFVCKLQIVIIIWTASHLRCEIFVLKMKMLIVVKHFKQFVPISYTLKSKTLQIVFFFFENWLEIESICIYIYMNCWV